MSRAYRENDYLLGRLHAIDRLIDIVCDSARIDAAHEGIDVVSLKRRAFTRVLDAEAPRLTESAALIAALRQRIAEMGTAARTAMGLDADAGMSLASVAEF